MAELLEKTDKRLIKVSDDFAASMEAFIDTEDLYIDYLRHRDRFYLGVKKSSFFGGVNELEAAVKDDEDEDEDSRKRRPKAKQRVKSKVRQPVKVKAEEKVLEQVAETTAEESTGLFSSVGAKLLGASLIVGGVIIALLDSPAPGPADAVGAPLVIKGAKLMGGAGAANNIVKFTRVLTKVPLPLGKGGLITKPTKALIGEDGPELVLPLGKLGKAIDIVYQQGASIMIGATKSFLGALMPSAARSGLLQEASQIESDLGVKAPETSGGGHFGLIDPIEWWNRGRNERVKNENEASWKELWEDDNAQKGMSDENFEKGGKAGWFGRPDQAFNIFRPAEKGGPGSGPTPMVRQVFERPVRGMMNIGRTVGNMFAGPQDGSIPVPYGGRIGYDMNRVPILLNPPTQRSWLNAVRDAASDGVNLPAGVTSSFRTAAEQQTLIENEDDPGVFEPAPLGMSPHQQGWGVDISPASPAHAWMMENGSKYGFGWSGESDPVHFDFMNNEARDKWIAPDMNSWMSDVDTSVRGKLMGKAFDVGKNLVKGGKGLLEGAMKFIGKAFGDGKEYGTGNIDGTPTLTVPPAVKKSSETLINQPVSQSDRETSHIVPMVVPVRGNNQVIPISSDGEKKINRNYIIDVFSKGLKVEVYHGE